MISVYDHDDEPICASFSPDGTIRVWDVENQAERLVIVKTEAVFLASAA